MKLDDLKLRTKALMPLAIMVVAVAAMAAIGACKLAYVSSSANDIIAHRDKAAVYVARATRTMMMAPYSVFGALVYDGSSPEGRTAQADFYSQVDKLDSLLDTASQLSPDYASTFADLKTKFHALAETAKKPLAIGEDLPGLAIGKDLKADDLEKLAEGAKQVADVDAQARKMANGLLALNDTMINENAKAAIELTGQSQTALITLALVALVSALAAGALTAWISQSKIAKPLARLAEQMQALAGGDLAVEIGGHDRKDEIGDMARAVQVFKDHAIIRRDLENAALSNRDSAEAERQRASSERARAASAQGEVVVRLGNALNSLAGGDLTIRLSEGFSPEFAKIKDDFNAAVERLKKTVVAVVSSADAIRRARRKFRPLPTAFRSGPNSRPQAWKKPPRRSNKSPLR